MADPIKKPRKPRTIKPKLAVKADKIKPVLMELKECNVFDDPGMKPYKHLLDSYRGITPVYPDDKSEFIDDLSKSICKWRSKPGKEAMAYAQTYENVLCELLKTDETE